MSTTTTTTTTNTTTTTTTNTYDALPSRARLRLYCGPSQTWNCDAYTKHDAVHPRHPAHIHSASPRSGRMALHPELTRFDRKRRAAAFESRGEQQRALSKRRASDEQRV
eukprot:6818390-Prymnesium_polylepis.2